MDWQVIPNPRSYPSLDRDEFQTKIRLWCTVKSRFGPASEGLVKIPTSLKSVFLFLFTFVFCSLSWAQEVRSPYLIRSTLGEAGFSVMTSIEGRTYAVQASVGQPGAIGTYYGVKYSAIQGFIQPYTLASLKEPLPFSNLLVTVFPNPFSDEITISFSKPIKGDLEVEVFDMLGGTVFSKSYFAEQLLEVRFNPLSHATYILKITYKNQAYLKRITKN